MKRAFIFIFTSVLLISALSFNVRAASYRIIPINVNSKRVDFSGYLVSNTTYVPFDSFFGSDKIVLAKVSYNASAKTAIAVFENTTVTAKSGQKYITLSGNRISSNAANRIIDGKLYIPVRSAAKCFEIEVVWYAKTKSVDLIIPENSYDEQNINESGPYYNEDDLYWLSRIIHSEAAGQPFDGMIAVGNVVMNRVKSVDYPDSIHDVIFDTKYGIQFAPAANGTVYNDPDEESVRAAKIVLDGYTLSDKILYFVNHSLSSSQWFYTRTFVFKIGDHTFYY